MHSANALELRIFVRANAQAEAKWRLRLTAQQVDSIYAWASKTSAP